jgi:hypothetical protein
VANPANQCTGADDDERRSGCLVRGEAKRVDEQGDGQDRSAAAHAAQGEADREAERQREQLVIHLSADAPTAVVPAGAVEGGVVAGVGVDHVKMI